MPSFTTTRQVDHSAEQMFNLVADVEKYPEFLPMCEALVIKSQTQKDDKTLFIADMSVGYKMISETFTTRVLLSPSEQRIDASYIDGPFKYLENRWRFIADENDPMKCNIEFFIDYEFKNKMLGLLMGSMFDIAFRKFTDAFESRADAIYKSTNHNINT